MKIDHIAIWANNIEELRHFYMNYFGMTCNDKYYNPKKDFTSYFLSLDEGETRIELMHNPIIERREVREMLQGLTHLAISVGSKEKVDELTERLRNDGYTIAGEPRTTGDGYYESVVLDTEGNRVEISE